jgi:hypothetical protein
MAGTYLLEQTGWQSRMDAGLKEYVELHSGGDAPGA